VYHSTLGLRVIKNPHAAAGGSALYGEDGEAEEKTLAEADVRREMLR